MIQGIRPGHRPVIKWNGMLFDTKWKHKPLVLVVARVLVLLVLLLLMLILPLPLPVLLLLREALASTTTIFS